MVPERTVLRAFAHGIARRICRKAISLLQSRKAELTGDDTELGGLWDEICVQVQGEHSFFWDAYDDTARSFISGGVDALEEHEKACLWFQTDSGWAWLYDHPKTGEAPPVVRDEIVDYILHEHLYSMADTWSNPRIRAFLQRVSIRD